MYSKRGGLIDFDRQVSPWMHTPFYSDGGSLTIITPLYSLIAGPDAVRS